MPHLFRPAPAQNRYYAWFSALHTRLDLLLLGSQTEAEFEAAERVVLANLQTVERMGYRFDPDSELSRAVRAASLSTASKPDPGSRPRFNREHTLLSPALFELLSRCLRANTETGGLFDITVNSPSFVPPRADYKLLNLPCVSSIGFPLPPDSGEGAGSRERQDPGDCVRVHTAGCSLAGGGQAGSFIFLEEVEFVCFFLFLWSLFLTLP